MIPGMNVIMVRSGDSLAESFVKEARRLRSLLGPFELLPVVTSSTLLSESLREAYAREVGCAGSFEFTALVPFINTLLESKEEGRQVMTRTRLAHDLLGVFLSQKTTSIAELAPCERYLDSAPGAEGRSARAVSLAFKLAGLFEEYSLSRADWLTSWEEERRVLSTFPAEILATEAWQSALWRELRKNPGILSVPEAHRVARSTWKPPRVLVIAGLDLVADSYLNVFTDLSAHTQIVWLRLDPGEKEAPRSPNMGVWLCPGFTREAETIALEVRKLVAGGADPRRILVMHPSSALEDPGASLHQAFQAYGIPVSTTGGGVGGAVRQFMALVGSDLPRHLLLPWLADPVARAQHPDVPFDDAMEIFREMGLLRRVHVDDNDEERARTWEGGLDRLLAGFALGDKTLVEGPKGSVAPWHAGALDPEALGALCHYMRGLLVEMESLGSFKGPMGLWSAKINGALGRWLKPEGRTEVAWGRLKAGLGALEGISDPAIQLGWPEFKPFLEELVAAHLESPNMVAGGIRVGDPSRLHALACDSLFISGLNEGVFPSSDTPDALDLRPHDPRPGDAGRRMQDLARLHTAVGSCQQLRLTASDRDETTLAERAPSGWLEDMAHQNKVHPVRVSLFRHEEPPGEALGTPAGLEWAVNQERIQGIPKGNEPQEWKRLLGFADVTTLAASVKPRRRALLHNLEAFLWCEAQGLARHALGLSSTKDDETLASFDDLVPDLYVRERLLREAVAGAASAEEAVGNLRESSRLAALQGRGPSSRRSSLWMEHDQEALRRLLSFLPPDTRLDALRLGEAKLGQRALPALYVGESDLVGTVDLFAPGLLVQWHPLASSSSHKKDRCFLRGRLDHVVLSALGDVGVRRLQVIPAQGKIEEVKFMPVSQERAREWIESLLEDMNSLSPVRRVHASAFIDHKTPEEILGQLEKDADTSDWNSPYRGPLPEVELLPLPDIQEVARVHEKRYSLLKNLVGDGS